ncbi:MAG: LLM class flavin-dependent oxidoreductase [Chloroflexi bacterium]|nr:LLM class flavin-dependent oxidoreductase [Chloroflexota bacterium]
MYYGLDIPPFGPLGDALVLAGLAREAEDAGWDGFFIWDHIAREWRVDVVDTWIALAAIAMQTATIRFGPLVTPLPRRRPWKLARETVSLDHLSGGRLVFGVGLGSGRDCEWRNMGEETDLKTRGAMADEGLEIITRLWYGESFSFEGQHYTITDAHFTPKPLQQPRIPIWTGGYWPARPPFRRAARWDGVFPLGKQGGLLQPADIRVIVDFVGEHRQSSAPFDVVYRHPAVTDLDQGRELVTAYADAGATWWLEAIHPVHFGGNWEGDWMVERMRARILQGPPRI